MALQSSGPISLSDIQTEFGGTNPISLSEYYGSDTVPISGAISLADFYGTSAFIPFAWNAMLIGGGGGGGDGINGSGIGGGGAAGEVNLVSGTVSSAGTTWTIIIGAGGVRAQQGNVANSSGGTTSLTGTDSGNHTAAGGGYGSVAGTGTGSNSGHTAVSGGGGSNYDGNGNNGAVGPNGYSGGDSGQWQACNGNSNLGRDLGAGGGGGAGAGGSGFDGSWDTGGVGGFGVNNDYATGSNPWPGKYAGGGGGGGPVLCGGQYNQTSGGSGSWAGGDGAGGSFLIGFDPGKDAATYGSGGGGGNQSSNTTAGGNGKAGVVIIRVPQAYVAASTTGNPTVRTYTKNSVDYRSYEFASSGSIVW